MFEFKISKTSNEIEDICVAYGVCKILKDNDIPFRLKDNSSKFSIYTEIFDLEELEYYEMDNAGKPWNLSSYTTNSEYKDKSNKINEYMEENIVSIFKYILKDDKEFKDKNINYSSWGNNYCTKSNSNIKTAKSGSRMRHYLSAIGWLHGCSYIRSKYTDNQDIEATIILKPKDTDEIKKPYNGTYVNKDTGEVKIYAYSKKSQNNVVADIYCKTSINYNLLADEYDGIIVMYCTATKNKPMPNKTEELKIHRHFSNNFYNEMIRYITHSYTPIDVEIAVSQYVLNLEKYKEFSNLIRACAKNNTFIKNNLKKEMVFLYGQIIKDIYDNIAIMKLGKGLNRLLYENKGYMAQIKLYGVANEKHIHNCVRLICDEYKRTFGYSVISDAELLEVIEIIDGKDNAKICADAIISYAKVFIENKKEIKGE